MGWYDFQKLCETIMSEIFGPKITVFSATNDFGVDILLDGILQLEEGALPLEGRTVVQSKHKSRAQTLTRSDLATERAKVNELRAHHAVKNYVLLTNVPVTGKTFFQLEKDFQKLGIDRFIVKGKEWIEHQISREPQLRRLVPRLYGLGDLSQILDERVYAQASSILSSMSDDMARIVVTNTYRKALRTLENAGIVLLVGEPMAGKSTIASSLALSVLEDPNYYVIKLDHIGQFGDSWNPDETGQFFWVDDVFGEIRYDPSRVNAWNSQLVRVQNAVARNAKLVLTSRDYIWEEFKTASKRRTLSWLESSRLVVNVAEYAVEEKKQIIYNHLKFGRQPAEFRSRIKSFLSEIAESVHFVPEVARRLGDPRFTGGLLPTQLGVRNFFARPKNVLRESIEELSQECRVALFLIFFYGGTLPHPIPDTVQVTEFLACYDSSLSKADSALHYLRGSMVSLDTTESRWYFKHPTFKEALVELIKRDNFLIRSFLKWAPLETLLWEFSCRDAPRSIKVPSGLLEELVARLADQQEVAPIADFLVARGNYEILECLVKTGNLDQMALTKEHPRLLITLQSSGLLEERVREAAKLRLRLLVQEEWDFLIFREPQYLTLFTHEEESHLGNWTRSFLCSEDLFVWGKGLAEEIATSADCDPIFDEIDALMREFGGDGTITARLEEILSDFEFTRDELRGLEHEAMLECIDPDDYYLGYTEEDEDLENGIGEPDQDEYSRCIFDDVDE